MRDEELLQLIEKIAKGYEYEEVQTIIEETHQGTKKRIVRTKKYQPASLQAAQYLMTKNKKVIAEEDIDKLIEENMKLLEADDKWKL